MSDQFLKIPALVVADACAIPLAGVGEVPFDCERTVRSKVGMGGVSRFLALLSLF